MRLRNLLLLGKRPTSSQWVISVDPRAAVRQDMWFSRVLLV